MSANLIQSGLYIHERRSVGRAIIPAPRRVRQLLVLAAFLIVAATAGFAGAAPVVANVYAIERTNGSRLVDVYYDVSGGFVPMTVSLVFSSDNGATWNVNPTSGTLTGDAGPGITNGTDKHVLWDAGRDRPGVHWAQTGVKVMAADGPTGMVNVPAGTFMMGNSGAGDDATYGLSAELPAHQVTLSAYDIGKYDVTNGQYCAALNWALRQEYLQNSSGGIYAGGDVYENGQDLLVISDSGCQITYSGGVFTWKMQPGTNVYYSMETHPAVNVTWYGCAAYCNWLSAMNGLTPCYNLSTWSLIIPYPNGYRLPTEAEWERAAAWDGSKHWIYGFLSDTLTGKNRCNYFVDPDLVNPLGLTNYPYTSPVGWFNGVNISPNGSVQTVDSPSPMGCYDMSGNVWEWCQDWYHDSYTGAPADGSSWETQQSGYPFRVLRGGGWYNHGVYCRSALRGDDPPDDWNDVIGFRLARTP